MSILTTIKAGFSKAEFAVKAKSPEILAVTGVAAVVTGVVLACKATPKAIDILEEHKETMRKIDEVAADTETCKEKEYTEDDHQNDKIIVYIQTGWKLVKVYAPAAVALGLGIAAMLGSNYILKNRWLGAAAAYTGLNESLKQYRKRVADEVGEEAENDLFRNIKAIDVQKDDENGMPVIEKAKTFDRSRLGSPYAVIFDEKSTEWNKSPNENKMFLMCQQNWANDILRARGYLYLYEVYDMLGFRYEPKNDIYALTEEQARASRYVGWVYDSVNGDHYVDFGLTRAYDRNKDAFMKGYDPSVMLDFNVDGDILNTMYRK